MEKFNPHEVIDEKSIAVVNKKGVLRKLYCPFRVLCVHPVDVMRESCWYYVESVTGEGEVILYNIGTGTYSHSYFRIYIYF